MIPQKKNSGSEKLGDLSKVHLQYRTECRLPNLIQVILLSFANIKTVLPFPKYHFPDEGSHDRGKQEKPSELRIYHRKSAKEEIGQNCMV